MIDALLFTAMWVSTFFNAWLAYRSHQRGKALQAALVEVNDIIRDLRIRELRP